MKICEFDEILSFFAILHNSCSFHKDRVAFLELVLLELGAWIIKRPNEITSFTIVEVNYCNFALFNQEKVLFNWGPESLPNSQKRNVLHMRTSLLFYYMCHLLNHIIFLATQEFLFFADWAKIVGFFNPQPTSIARSHVSLIEFRRTMEECWRTHPNLFENWFRRKQWIDSFVVNLDPLCGCFHSSIKQVCFLLP